MRRIILFILLSSTIIAQSFGQSTEKNIINTDSTEVKGKDIIKDNNTWAIGGGFSNFIMHGDLRSISVADDSNYWNFGGYIYVDKMFNPILGLELKATYTKMSGGVQSFSNGYSLRYVPNNVISDADFRFEGRSYGAELNLIVSFTNMFKRESTKWHAAGYFGVGYHQYDSALYKTDPTGATPDELLVDFGYNRDRNSVNEASSIFLSAQLGVKRKISRRLDLEFRTGMYFNNEDHLDAAVSDKQTWESFFVTSLGVVFKLGKKKEYIIWAAEEAPGAQFKIVDTDNDGVMDELDVEPNTPKGAMVYGNGQAVDTDGDGLPDYKDKCPLEYGPLSNEGCPLNIDTDGDGVMDAKDLCPNTPGPVENRGCPKQEAVAPVNITQQIGLLATSIYFDTNKDVIKLVSYSTIDEIVGLMKQVPDVRFVIEGHTDDRNSDRYNLYLSQRRAESVRKYMIKQGIANERLEPKGYGESRPKFSNENAGGRQLNRRVEIKPINAKVPVEVLQE
ncbi:MULTISPECIES: OmpA family protein [unclassified Polaribacter]|uniref:OmpA family protein n=1 Tax=unclassified Polaribacter TaxID=196858 RepID=UPI001C4EA93B|nr:MULTISPECIES: OmpA family protein [unclassified Polaribacter]QXP64198.1 OmpA family protein [Polaribacter sp. HaHaR_3_91]QXP66703.1 OmpA family protein [Polaribacter sp. AHE13PA]QXP72189.1 OmpA family protein [Polaribacter sp. R2A056_3_33]